MPNYIAYRCDRSFRVGGGVLLYVKDTLPLSNVTDYDDTICQVVVGTCDVKKQIIASCLLVPPPRSPCIKLLQCPKCSFFLHT